MAEFSAAVSKLHNTGRHFVIITDPGVKIEQDYPFYEAGLAKGVFMLTPDGTRPQWGKVGRVAFSHSIFIISSCISRQVWPGLVHFPDWTHPEASDYWTQGVAEFHAQLGFDGLWTDMNEVANFCDGRCNLTWADGGGAGTEDQFSCNCTMDKRIWNTQQWDDPAYQPMDTLDRQCRSITGDIHGLDCGTLSMASQLYGGQIQYNYHNLYGHHEALLTAQALETVRGKRALVITRSTFPGTGHRAGHWLGDNNAAWHDLKMSVSGVLTMNLLGLPLVGADICGFGGTTTPELCTRWMQLGVFYPFMRNHNTQGAPGQEPYALGPDHLAASRIALSLRYQLLSHLYTLFADVHVKGGAVAAPLMYHFPDDPNTLMIDEQLMLGEALLASPVLYENRTEVEGYFPASNLGWYSLLEGKKIQYKTITVSGGGFAVLPTPLNHTNVHIHGGQVVALNEAGALNTVAQQDGNLVLVVALPATFEDAVLNQTLCRGHLFLDDGESLDTFASKSFLSVEFIVINADAQGSFILKSVPQHVGYLSKSRITSLLIYGALGRPKFLSTGNAKGDVISLDRVHNMSASNSFNISNTDFLVSNAFTLIYSMDGHDDPPQSDRSVFIAVVAACAIVVLGVFFLFCRSQTKQQDDTRYTQALFAPVDDEA
jgi:alpha-glucosidase (family GH31 glycosyl hydrolase)